MREHRSYGQRREISKCRWPTQDQILDLDHPVQIPWTKGTAPSPSRNKDKWDVSILKGTCYIIFWSGDLLLSYYLHSIYAESKRHLQPLQEHAGSRSKHPLRVLTPALEAVLCSSIQCGSQESPISAPVPNGSCILKSQMAKREEKTWEVQQISYCAIHLVWQHSGGRGCKPTTSSGALARSSRDRRGQGPHHFNCNTSSLGFHQPLCCDLVHHIKNTTAQVSHPCTKWGMPTNNMGGQREEVFTLSFPSSICLVRCAEGWMSAAHR